MKIKTKKYPCDCGEKKCWLEVNNMGDGDYEVRTVGNGKRGGWVYLTAKTLKNNLTHISR